MTLRKMSKEYVTIQVRKRKQNENGPGLKNTTTMADGQGVANIFRRAGRDVKRPSKTPTPPKRR